MMGSEVREVQKSQPWKSKDEVTEGAQDNNSLNQTKGVNLNQYNYLHGILLALANLFLGIIEGVLLNIFQLASETSP